MFNKRCSGLCALFLLLNRSSFSFAWSQLNGKIHHRENLDSEGREFITQYFSSRSGEIFLWCLFGMGGIGGCLASLCSASEALKSCFERLWKYFADMKLSLCCVLAPFGSDKNAILLIFLLWTLELLLLSGISFAVHRETFCARLRGIIKGIFYDSSFCVCLSRIYGNVVTPQKISSVSIKPGVCCLCFRKRFIFNEKVSTR